MADLDFNQANQPVTLVGSDETFAVDVNANKNLSTTSSLKVGGVFGVLLVSNNAAIEVKVGANRLENREVVSLYNNSNRTFYWGFSNSVTSATGMPIPSGSEKTWIVSHDVEIWVISDSGANNNSRIVEAR
jgi:hypothetical protein